MHSFQSLLIVTSWGVWIFRFFRRLGPLGLFLLSALDSSFLFLPFGNDVLLIALISSGRSGAHWITLVLMSALGSVVGVLLIDLTMRRAGEEGLKRFVNQKKIDGLRRQLTQQAGWGVFLATVLPPPFPFTPVVMAASALQFSRQKLLAVVFAGRMVRYTIDAVLAIFFGRQIIKLVGSPIVEYFVYALIVIAVIGSTLSIIKWTQRDGGVWQGER
jgi:membrane protein YqaA with SNARE-associated domain